MRSTFLESKVLTSEGDNFPLKLTLQKKGDSSIRNQVPWQISSNGKCRRSNQRGYKRVTSKWTAVVGVYACALYILTRYTHKYLIYKK